MKPLRTRRLLVPTLLGLLVVGLVVVLKISDAPAIELVRDRLEWVAFDLRMRATLDEDAGRDPRVVIVDIDERSLREQGHWPWPREKLAALVAGLAGAGSAVIGLDIVFAEEQANPAEQLAGTLRERADLGGAELAERVRAVAGSVDPDATFAEALAQAPALLGYVFSDRAGESVGMLPAPLAGIGEAGLEGVPLYTRRHYVANLPVLQSAALGGGFFSVEADGDGVVRRVPLLARQGDAVYGALSLEAARAYLGMPPLEPRVERIGDQNALEALSLGGFIDIPTDGAGRVIVPYRAPPGGFPYVSATDVLRGEVPGDVLADAIVLVGTSAEGLYDQRATPVQGVFPGVEIHANVIAGILDGAFPYEPPWAPGVDLTVLVLLGLGLAFLFPRLDALALALTSIGVVAAYVAANTWVWLSEGLVTTVAVPVVMVVLLSALNMTYGFLAERRNRERLKDMFGQYVPPALVDEMNARPEADFGFEGESREMTVLFCDIRGFTSISEALSAGELKKMLNHFFTPMTQIIFEQRGTIDKYVGDMIMAFWGAPLRDPDHRGHAIAAALHMLARVEALRPELRERGWPEINIGIGLNTGPMNVGDMGSSFRRAYTVIGDAVNLGSRLEGLTKFYGVGLIVSESTRLGQEEFVFRPLDRVRVKGKREPVAIFEPVCRVEEADEALWEELRELEAALADYCARRWDRADERLAGLVARGSDHRVYGLYRERIAELRGQTLADDWDGVFTHTSK